MERHERPRHNAPAIVFVGRSCCATRRRPDSGAPIGRRTVRWWIAHETGDAGTPYLTVRRGRFEATAAVHRDGGPLDRLGWRDSSWQIRAPDLASPSEPVVIEASVRLAECAARMRASRSPLGDYLEMQRELLTQPSRHASRRSDSGTVDCVRSGVQDHRGYVAAGDIDRAGSVGKPPRRLVVAPGNGNRQEHVSA
jgi:hypothetical protein